MDKTKFNEYLAEMKAQLIIEPEYLAASSLVDLNIDESKIIPYILEAQQLKLEPMIGSKMLRKLQESNLTFEYSLLQSKFLNYALLHWALAEFYRVAPFSVAKGGVYKHTSTDSETASPHDIATLVQHENYKADEFSRRMIDFLNKNKSYYPEYSECVGDGIKADKKARFTGGLNIEMTGYNYPDTEYAPIGFIDNSCEDDVCPSDPDVFEIATYWGNSDDIDMGFDPSTLSDSSNTVPPIVVAQPIKNYFWVVSNTKLNISQAGIPIPTSDFSDPDADGDIFVQGNEDDMFWIRVKIAETYESAVQFELST